MTSSSKEYMAEWRAKNKDKTKLYSKRHREKYGPKILTEEEKKTHKKYMKEYNKKNKNELREKKKIQIWANPEYAASLLSSKKNWQKRNLKQISNYHKRKRSTDINFKLSQYLRARMWKALKGQVKLGSSVKDLGCSIEEFKIYIEKKFDPWMTWNNYGEWEMDHKIPLAKFDLTIAEEFAKACHYTNIQPLWKSENRRKRAN